MQDYESVIVTIAFRNDVHELCPPLWRYVRRVYWRVKLVSVHFSWYQSELRNIVNKVVKVKRFQCSCHLIMTHTYGSTSID